MKDKLIKLEEGEYRAIVKNNRLLLVLDDNRLCNLRPAVLPSEEYMCDYDPKRNCEYEDTVYLGNFFKFCIGCGSKLVKNKLG